MKYKNAKDLAKDFEEFRPTEYFATEHERKKGIRTVGYGDTQSGKKEITQEDIQKMLSEGKIAAAILNQQEQEKLSNELTQKDIERYKQQQLQNLRATANEGGKYTYAEGGSMDDQMMMVMAAKPMESDIDMEDNYTNFIMEEALTEDEENMLVSKLEQDNELQILFDKVIDVAQEFAGSGPVDGPGSGVSDSIPARLSDGEFVFTAKATEQIGEDKLMSMMKEAEANADERQEMMHGGIPHMDKGEEQILSNVNRKQVVNTGTNVLEEDETSKNIKGNMYNPNIQDKYVRS